MKTIVASALASTLILAASIGQAQDKPFSMVGTWLFSGEGLTMGQSLHPERNTPEGEPRAMPLNLRFVIDKQAGSHFWGTSRGPSGISERLLGSLTRDGRRGVTINARGGTIHFAVVDANTIEGCYALHNDRQLAASCVVGVRQ